MRQYCQGVHKKQIVFELRQIINTGIRFNAPAPKIWPPGTNFAIRINV